MSTLQLRRPTARLSAGALPRHRFSVRKAETHLRSPGRITRQLLDGCGQHCHRSSEGRLPRLLMRPCSVLTVGQVRQRRTSEPLAVSPGSCEMGLDSVDITAQKADCHARCCSPLQASCQCTQHRVCAPRTLWLRPRAAPRWARTASTSQLRRPTATLAAAALTRHNVSPSSAKMHLGTSGCVPKQLRDG